MCVNVFRSTTKSVYVSYEINFSNKILKYRYVKVRSINQPQTVKQKRTKIARTQNANVNQWVVFEI